MLQQAAREFGLDLQRSFVAGDRIVDIQAGRAAGATSILVLTGYGPHALEECREQGVSPDYIVRDIAKRWASSYRRPREKHLRMTEAKQGRILTVTQLVCFVLFTLLGVSCSEEPTDQNSPSAPVELPGVTIHDTTIVAQGDSTFKKYIAMGGIDNLVGNAEGYTALSVIEFIRTASIFATR